MAQDLKGSFDKAQNSVIQSLKKAPVVDDAIRFVASNAVKTTERANADKIVTVDEEGIDIQGTEKSSQEQSITTTTNNYIF